MTKDSYSTKSRSNGKKNRSFIIGFAYFTFYSDKKKVHRHYSTVQFNAQVAAQWGRGAAWRSRSKQVYS
jgi:hypothetical protein